MKILNKNIISAYAKAIIEMISNGGCTIETTKNIRETLFALKEDWCDVTLEKYAQVGVILDMAFTISNKYCIENKVIDSDCTDFFYKMLELIRICGE